MRDKYDPFVQAFGIEAAINWDEGWDKIQQDLKISFQELNIYTSRSIDFHFSPKPIRIYRKYQCFLYGHERVNPLVNKNSYCKRCLKNLYHEQIN